MRVLSSILAMLTVIAGASAQAQATTLAELAVGADLVARARVLQVSQRAGTLSVQWRATEWIAGDGPATFELSEPAGRACGRALHGLAPGAGYLVFLDRRDGDLVLASPDSRSIVASSPGLPAHVRRLRQATGTARVDELARALEDRSPRIRSDAALALQVVPGVERAPAAVRARIVAALARGLESRPAELPALLGAAARTGEGTALDLLLPSYLRGQHGTLDRALRRAITAFDAGEIARRLSTQVSPATAGRVVALALELDPRAGSTVLLAVAVGGDRAARVHATRALLRRGAGPDILLRLGVAAEAVARASTRARSDHRFRSIDLDRSR